MLVIEHNLDVIKTADWIIDLGPEGGNGGGTVVVEGTPEEVATESSWTGQFLAPLLAGATLDRASSSRPPVVACRRRRRGSACAPAHELSHVSVTSPVGAPGLRQPRRASVSSGRPAGGRARSPRSGTRATPCSPRGPGPGRLGACHALGTIAWGTWPAGEVGAEHDRPRRPGVGVADRQRSGSPA